MELKHQTIEFKTKDGKMIHVRAQATRGDQYEMHAAMSDGMQIADGKIIKANPMKLFPWLIERFCGPEVLNNILAEPADPEEDLIMVLGSFILNHARGLTLTPEDAAKKKG